MLLTATHSLFLRSPPISGHRYPPSPSTAKFRCSAVVQSAPSTCLYEVLRIPMGASCKEIKAAYRRLARICHPDVSAESPADEFVRINAAYSILSDPDKRADYDRRVSRRFRHHGDGAMDVYPNMGFSGYTCRKWETDQCW